MQEIERQKVLRSFSATEGSGFFVWEVLEVIRDPGETTLALLTACRDGSYILIQCFHFWIEGAALEALYRSGEDWDQDLTVIPE